MFSGYQSNTTRKFSRQVYLGFYTSQTAQSLFHYCKLHCPALQSIIIFYQSGMRYVSSFNNLSHQSLQRIA
jgi:hypothetical protein